MSADMVVAGVSIVLLLAVGVVGLLSIRLGRHRAFWITIGLLILPVLVAGVVGILQ